MRLIQIDNFSFRILIFKFHRAKWAFKHLQDVQHVFREQQAWQIIMPRFLLKEKDDKDEGDIEL